MPGFARRSSVIEVLLGEDERRLVELALGVLEDVDRAGDDDPAAERLRYSAHPEDPAEDDRFRALTQGMLQEARRADREALSRTLHAASLTVEEAEAWMRVIGEARLALGARVGLTEDGWEERLAASLHPPPGAVLVDLMARIQDGLVSVLSD